MTTGVQPSLNGHAPDAENRVLDALGNEFTLSSLAILAAGGLTAEQVVRFGVRAVRHPDHVPEEIDRYWITGPGRGPGMLFEWRDLDRTVVQFRPDVPVVDDKGDAHKYILPSGCGTFLSHLRAPTEDSAPYLLVEGTKQGLAAAVWAPAAWGVVAVPGCNSWVGTDLTWAEDREVVVLFDGDVTTNRDVHDAAVQLKEALEAEGAASVAYAKLAGARAKEGLDDVLGRRAADKRTDYVQRIVTAAVKKLPRTPARRSTNAYIGEKGLLTRSAALAVLEGQPAALGAGSQVALYRDGVFTISDTNEPLVDKVTALLGEEYRIVWRATIEEFLIGELYRRGSILPERASKPLLNCRNGMLDLRTGELLPHAPEYLSTRQIPVAWDPEAQCPRYLDWLGKTIPNQWAEIEEVASTMLDPTRTPSKTLFAFGPSKSGKSTFIRILEAIAGDANRSNVSMQQMAENRFMVAPLYQKMLNSSADLSSAHLADVSLFKMLTGEDGVRADRKYGKTFDFKNQALFAFSANDLPTVSEGSDAYTNRIAPFLFPHTFAGRENPKIEKAILEELPGILARWVRSWQAFDARGGYLPANADVAQEFEARSDRIARWVTTRCDVFPEAVGKTVGPDQGTSLQNLYTAFLKWAQEENGGEKPRNPMGRTKFSERLRALRGVGDAYLRHNSRNKGLNVVTHGRDDGEIGSNRANHPNDCVGCVGCVEVTAPSPYVRTESELIKGERGPVDTHSHGKGATGPTQPTQPTQSNTMVPKSRDEAATAFLFGAAGPTQPTRPVSAEPPKPRAVSDADALAFLFGSLLPPPAVTEREADVREAFPEPPDEPNPFTAPAAEPTDPDDGFDWES